ncbi:2,4-dienoyl-CoA reductase-like NADH-dependent reductase (Old Yellow Enzyme family) [Roseimicrobium gellanilyticum]|uniref:2,4-dienoyl-CoA reductase-like NADH-dependent reductase (Old Yellow Enzyme family) n=1 Tax=Roseimicrobium gellanilyticum TaxID=748857 RepID=A0A366H361_9BACT|nr:NADH:flavin oxidoreductase/NADH oxidase [Roseimicrobium gellanilyticum]RBP35218.1 2,4-dienoyl-CoA reductase-like NADH-dependent reductase (Old Yellow Enzyme family) [Roseimicrobium gellanilyticum]
MASDLFSTLKLRDVTFRNRIGVSPMCQYSSEDGFANDWHLVHLGSRAVGGAALVMTEAAAVLPEGRISPQDLGIWKDAHIEMLQRIFRFVESHGGVPAMQLAHAGRKASTAAPWKGREYVPEEEGGWRPIYAPSAVPFEPQGLVPTELDLAGIQRVVQAYADAARRALESGARVVEIHAAHGYLLHEFLSPLTNLRTDGYGGSFENRTRALLETVTAVREVWPERLPLLVRISATDWVEGGWDGDNSVELARMLKPLGVDMMDCSTGGTVPDAKVPTAPGYQVPFADRIRSEAGIPTAAVGMITGAQQADEIIRTGKADMVFLARQLLRDPYWPLHAARELGQKFPVPEQYQRAF